MKLYHGTSSIYLKKILREGLTPQEDLIEKSPSIHLSETFSQAERYAHEKTGRTKKIKHPYKRIRGNPIVIEVEIPESHITNFIGTRMGKDYWTIHNIPPNNIIKIYKV